MIQPLTIIEVLPNLGIQRLPSIWGNSISMVHQIFNLKIMTHSLHITCGQQERKGIQKRNSS